MTVFSTTLKAGACFVALSAPAVAQEGFQPDQNCFQVVTTGAPATKIMVASWIMGYLASGTNQVEPVTFDNVEVVLNNLREVCGQNQDLSLLEVVARSGPSKSTAPATNGSMSVEDSARALLMKFLDPKADRAAMTAELKPSEADVRAVYKDPLATRLVEAYDSMFQPGVAIGPNKGQTDLLLVVTTTSDLIRGADVLGSFPGGYSKVTRFLNPDIPIARFKFVKPGEDIGMAFDGLVFVNDHWVLMPKPWRLVE
ncbi:MAG TPA: hypothetical protein ENK28_05800 [Aliiroseovarius sp.]|nr:hypothetical protein [Aliiroseovarius sp.]